MASKKLYIDIAARVRSATRRCTAPPRPFDGGAPPSSRTPSPTPFTADNPAFDRERFAGRLRVCSGEAHNDQQRRPGHQPARKLLQARRVDDGLSERRGAA